ncbi:YggT family protein [Microbacterium rhizosphaerae]|uniref:YggT family protein n=1 Tax=Microbacterium rhizosphaerae TaxID=1678237 RepID=A0ABZ0SVC8_9MICO|nr:YggT family protein [Microbacterium rhizosphaerae]WPR91192.1 YggT family protein [Microbacterium rhizosphaerae]
MVVISLIATVINTLLLIYVFVMLARMVLDFMPMLNREWRPRGAGLIAAELVYTVTDPPIRLFRRFIPPLRLGPVAFDLAFSLTLLLCFILIGVTRSLAG